MDLSKNFDKTHMASTNHLGYVVQVYRNGNKTLAQYINEAIASNQHKGTLSSIAVINHQQALLHFTTYTQPHQLLERVEAIERTLSSINEKLDKLG